MNRPSLALRLVLLSIAACVVLGLTYWMRTERAAREVQAGPVGSGVISGVVVDTDGRPIAGVTIEGGDDTQRVRRGGVTDGEGRFALVTLPAGGYQVFATKPGYHPTYYGERHPGVGWVFTAEMHRVGPTLVPLGPAQRVSDLKLKMARLGVLGGVVLTSQGVPAAGWQVRAMRIERRPDNEREVTSASVATTDATGRYRIEGLAPGTYIVRARHALAFNTTVYHPDSVRRLDAWTISLGPGEEKLEVNIHGKAPRTSSIEGVVTRNDGQPVPKARVDLTDAGPVEPDSRRHTVTTGPNGEFVFEQIPAGGYWLVAQTDVTAGSGNAAIPVKLWAMSEVAASGREPARVKLVLATGSRIVGRIVVERRTSAPAPDLSGVSVFLKPADGRTETTIRTGVPTTKANVSGDFTFDDVPAGSYALETALGRPWMLDSIGIRGHMTPGSGIVVKAFEEVTGVIVTLTDRLNTLAGTVVDDHGKPVPFSLVVAFGAEPGLRAARHRTRAARAGSDGTFTLDGLPSGEYFVAVADDSEPSLWYTPEFFERLAPAAARVILVHGERRILDLTVPRQSGLGSPFD
jgi:protocatechuate 3,4-dioxygenase beta subunit